VVTVNLSKTFLVRVESTTVLIANTASTADGTGKCIIIVDSQRLFRGLHDIGISKYCILCRGPPKDFSATSTTMVLANTASTTVVPANASIVVESR
jgi:hypothetical protein